MTAPWGVMRATASRLDSVNQTLPSGPAVMPSGPAPGVIPAVNSVIAPSGVTRAMRPGSAYDAAHTLPSAPRAMPAGFECGVSPAANSESPDAPAEAAGTIAATRAAIRVGRFRRRGCTPR